MKIKMPIILVVLFLQIGCAQVRSLSNTEQKIFATALKGRNGASPVYPPTLYVDSGLVNYIKVFLSENDAHNKNVQFVRENGWSFIYEKMKEPKSRKPIKLSAKELLATIGIKPVLGDRNGTGTFSPILMNDEKTKAFLIYDVIYQGGGTLFFELKDKEWVLVKQDVWLD